MSYIDGFLVPAPTDNRDERMMAEQPPFDGKRMIFGGFEPVVDLKA